MQSRNYHNHVRKNDVIPFHSFLFQIGRVVEHPEAVTEILNSHDMLRAMVLCIREENMSVAKQVDN